jgi:hypothetical protein
VDASSTGPRRGGHPRRLCLGCRGPVEGPGRGREERSRESGCMTTPGPGAVQAPGLRHRVMGGFIGNVVEWYDFALYGYLAGVIAPVLVPRDTPTGRADRHVRHRRGGLPHATARGRGLRVVRIPPRPGADDSDLGRDDGAAHAPARSSALVLECRDARAGAAGRRAPGAGRVRRRRVLVLGNLSRRDRARGQARPHRQLGQHRVDDRFTPGCRRGRPRHECRRRRDPRRVGVAPAVPWGAR